MRHQEIERLLPAVYRASIDDAGPLRALIGVMEALHDRPERELASLDATLNPRRAPDDFVPLLANWVDLAWLWTETGEAPTSGPVILDRLGHLRELVASAAYLSQWRGTARGLKAFLQRATGLGDIELIESPQDEGGRRRPFHVRIQLPETAGEPRIRALITRIIEMEKPAYLTYEIILANPSPGS